MMYRVSSKTVPTWLFYLLFCRLLLMQIAKVGSFMKNSGNLLQDRHKNFENWFRNSWDNWGQSWHPSFRNWHFAITKSIKKTIWCYRCQLWPQLSQLFLNQFSKFLWLSCSKFPGLLNKGQKFLCTCSRTRENDKNKVGTYLWDTLYDINW